MSIEKKNKLNENIDWNLEKKDKKINNLMEKTNKNIEKTRSKEQTHEDLQKLEELVKKWIISQESADKIKSSKIISKQVIEEMFDKIDEIENIKNVDQYLPSNLRITKQEYLQAVENKIFRIQTITKLNMALNFISEQIPGNSSWYVDLFVWFLSVLDKNLILLQENTIDIKENLQKLDKTPTKPKTWRSRFLDFISKFFK